MHLCCCRTCRQPIKMTHHLVEINNAFDSTSVFVFAIFDTFCCFFVVVEWSCTRVTYRVWGRPTLRLIYDMTRSVNTEHKMRDWSPPRSLNMPFLNLKCSATPTRQCVSVTQQIYMCLQNTNVGDRKRREFTIETTSDQDNVEWHWKQDFWRLGDDYFP